MRRSTGCAIIRDWRQQADEIEAELTSSKEELAPIVWYRQRRPGRDSRFKVRISGMAVSRRLRAASKAVFLEQLGRRSPSLTRHLADEPLEHLLECTLP